MPTMSIASTRRRDAWILGFIFMVCAGLAQLASHACAQPGPADKAMAEALFDRGLTLMREGQFEEAARQLEQSQAIERGIGTMLYLAECYEKLGKTASAWAMFREAASAARAENQPDRAKAGTARADRLEPQLSRMTIEPSGARDIAGLAVTRNGQVVPNGALGVPLPSDPGEQRIEARAPGRLAWSTVVTLPPNGSTLTVDVPELAPDPEALQPSAAAQPAVTAPESSPLPPPSTVPGAVPAPSASSTWQKPAGLTLGGAGIVALGVGAFFGARAISKNDSLKDACPSLECSAKNKPLQDSAESAATLSTAFWVGGAALLGIGAIVFLTAPSEHALALDVQARPGVAQVQLRGAF
jgi:hypothetical protein